MAKPFLKWAGGKTQLISAIARLIPKEYKKRDFIYIEPFVGSGAMLFFVLEHYPHIQKAVINDVNSDLASLYKIIRDTPNELIKLLDQLEIEYFAATSRSDYYYQKRNEFNARNLPALTQSAIFVFLNRTCYNGLFRVNSKNEFNVPIGDYKNPKISDQETILQASSALQKVEILCGDFAKTADHTLKNSFFYFDPPYKPVSQTASFNSYAQGGFDDNEQTRLRDFCHHLHTQGARWIVSNSDPKNRFFDELYSGYKIKRVNAKRNINRDATKRGATKEIIICNF